MKKKNLSLWEFKKYCEENKYEKVIYHTDNQPRTGRFPMIILNLVFESIKVIPERGIVFLKSAGNSMQINGVKGISVLSDISFSVVCDGSWDDKKDMSYVFYVE